jgi:hypothetical protein
LENKVSAIIIYDFENDVNLDTMIFDPKPHPIWGVRNYDNIKFLNDSIAIGLIRGGIIKFKFVLETSSIDGQNHQDNYKVYPNPTTGLINIEFNSPISENVSIEIVNELGEVMGNFQKQIFTGKNTLNYDITSYPKGIYFVRIKEQNITFKLVKE